MKPGDCGGERSPAVQGTGHTTLLNTSASRLRGCVLVPPHLRTRYFLDLLIPVKLPQFLSSMTTKSLMRDTLFALAGLEHCSLRGSCKDMNEAAEVVFLRVLVGLPVIHQFLLSRGMQEDCY